MIIILLLFAIVLLMGLLFFEKTENRKGMLPTKTVLSLLFIITAISQIHLMQPYTLFIIIGLLFCLGGDVFLALPQDRMFLFGLVSFLLGHVCYVIGFIWIAGPSSMTLIGVIITMVLGVLVYLWLKPHLGTMKIPVIAYILVISFMFIGAWSVLGMPQQPIVARLLVFVGAASFYLSDIFVARDRFLKTDFINRLLGLPLYYLAQFMIAFSIGVVR
ncbi:lysoplasmalogenase [Thermodesulfobacteriota bacterium]